MDEEGTTFDTFIASSDTELQVLNDKLIEMDATLEGFQKQLNESEVGS